MGRELEVDGVFDGEDILIPGIMEHVERAGVHSGDSIAVYPPLHLEDKHRELILKHTKNMAKHLGVIGLINAQYILYNDDIYVIEVNPRSSRTIPYISKVTGVPIIDLATKVMLGQKLKDLEYGTGIYREADYYAVKAPVFSFEKLTDVDTGLGPEMKSTGEVLGLAETFPQAVSSSLSRTRTNRRSWASPGALRRWASSSLPPPAPATCSRRRASSASGSTASLRPTPTFWI